jgi:hypothetical protein
VSFNLKSGIRWITLAGTLVVSTGCTVWQVPEFNRLPFNAESGDIVNVEMEPAIIDGIHPWDRCMNMGGRGMYQETREVSVGTPPIPGAADNHAEDNIVTALVTVIICERVDF